LPLAGAVVMLYVMLMPGTYIKNTSSKLLFVGCLLVFLLASLPITAEAGNSTVEPTPRSADDQKRFLALNKRVKAKQGKVDLVFIGDSITQLWDSAGRGVWSRYYGDRKALNLGVSGDRIQNVLWRLDNGNLDGIQPQVAVLMIGANNFFTPTNSVAEIVDGVAAVVQLIRKKLPDTKILLLDILPQGKRVNLKRRHIDLVNQELPKLDNGQDIIFLPIGKAFLQPDGILIKELMPDFLHPSRSGYNIMAAEIEPVLASLLGDTPKSFDPPSTPVN
jgi:lysophospholipase L1-like esterase